MTTTNSRLGSILIVSLVLNAFLIGAGTMHLLSHRRARAHHQRFDGHHRPAAEFQGRGRGGDRRVDRPAHARLLRQIVRVMGGPRDPRAEALLSKSRKNMRSTRASIAHAQDELEQALLAQPYDEAAFQKAVVELNRVSSVAQANAQKLLIELAGQLTPEERKKLSERPEGAAPREGVPPRKGTGEPGSDR